MISQTVFFQIISIYVCSAFHIAFQIGNTTFLVYEDRILQSLLLQMNSQHTAYKRKILDSFMSLSFKYEHFVWVVFLSCNIKSDCSDQSEKNTNQSNALSPKKNKKKKEQKRKISFF